jgi:hypothetical protein
MNFAQISFNPEKCRIIVYNANNELKIPLMLPNEKNEKKVVKTCEVDDTIKYFEVLLRIRKLVKMKYPENNEC